MRLACVSIDPRFRCASSGFLDVRIRMMGSRPGLTFCPSVVPGAAWGCGAQPASVEEGRMMMRAPWSRAEVAAAAALGVMLARMTPAWAQRAVSPYPARRRRREWRHTSNLLRRPGSHPRATPERHSIASYCTRLSNSPRRGAGTLAAQTTCTEDDKRSRARRGGSLAKNRPRIPNGLPVFERVPG